MNKKIDYITDDYDIKKIYEQIELDLITSMKRTLALHKADEKLEGFDWPSWQTLKLKQMKTFREENKELFGTYEDKIDKYVYKSIKNQFKEGASKANKQAIEAGFLRKDDAQLGGSFFGVNSRKVNALAGSIQKDLEDVKIATLRMSNDVYRSTIYKASQMSSFGAKTLNQAIDMATNDFLKRGFNCIIYKDGRKVDIADYADMAVRTATKRANLMGEGELRKQIGNPLVYVSKHGTSCKKCNNWAGKIYIDDVWSGGTSKDGKYPLLSAAIEGGLFHPRCRHGMSTYFEGVNEEPEEIQESENNKNDAYIQELQRRQKEYERLAAGSLLSENVFTYQNKVKELQNQIEGSKIELSDDEQYAINRYISSESYKINEILRDELKLTKQQEKVVESLDKALEKMPNFEGNVNRSLIVNKDELNKFLQIHKIGNKVLYKAYISTTAKNRYNDLSNVELHIKSKKGKDLRNYNKEEQEILFERNSEFKIIQLKEINKAYHVYMEEL